MRGLLMVLPVLLATLFQPVCPSITSNSSMNIKDHPEVLANVEASLLSLFGFRKRPRPAKIVVPEAMLEMYRRQTGLDVDTSALPLPGRHTQTANTVRSFSHVVSSTDGRFPSQNKFRLSFDVKSIPKIEKLKAAEVQLNREAVTTEAGKKTPLSEVSSTDKVNNVQVETANTLPDSDAQKTIVKEKNETTNATTKATRSGQARPADKPRKVPARRHLLRILVHDILKPGIRGRRKPIFRLIDSKVIDIRDSEAIMVDVLPAVERWIDNPKENYGLLIEVMPVDASNNSSKSLNHVRLRRAADENDEEWHPKQPLLLTFTDDGKNKVRTGQEIVNRTRRAPQAMKRAAAQSKRRGRENCRRYPLYVDFQDVGWNDWIVAPPGYDAYYCHGDCPFPLADHLNSTNHAIVQTLVNSVNPSAVPKACCVPTSLTSISMLYLDEESKVVLKNYQDMAVIGCGCR